METLIVILLIAGLACFLVAAMGRPNRLNFTALGLACWISTVLLPHLTR
jgi:hypothetical protein